jgi:hypothetical protein
LALDVIVFDSERFHRVTVIVPLFHPMMVQFIHGAGERMADLGTVTNYPVTNQLVSKP